MKIKAPVNFRAFVITAVAVTCAIFCAYAYMCNKQLGLTLGILYLFALFGAAGYFIYRFIKNKVKLRVVIAICLSAVFGLLAYTLAVTYFNERNEIESDVYRVTGRVCSMSTRSGFYAVDLENVTLAGKSCGGLMRLSIDATDENVAEVLKCGDKLSFSAYVTVSPFVEDGVVNGSSYRTDIRYRATVNGENITVKFGEPSLYEKFIVAFHNLFTDNMGEKYGNIAFSMITGDKTALSYSISEEYSLAGFGHIMAVSGLHIGFLVLILNLILCRVPIRIRYPVIGALLIIYAGIAGFSPSVVRAVIMAFISGASVLIFARRDLLSSLMCAYTLILAFKPIYLFEAGFLMSFGSIFGIAIFAGMIKRLLARIRVGNKLGNAVSASLSVCIGVLPAQIYFFERINLLSWIVNVILLPYITLVYIVTLVVAPFAAIPDCGVLLTVCKYLYMPLDYMISQIAIVPNAVLAVTASAAVFTCFPIMFCAGEPFMIRKGKWAVILNSVIAGILIFVVAIFG